MANQSRSNNVAVENNIANESNDPNFDLTGKLVAQLLHNNENPQQPCTYVNFASNHSGHLDLERRIKLVSIIRSSTLADKYKFGSSLGIFYIKNTYRYPSVTPEMIGAVMSAESTSN